MLPDPSKFPMKAIVIVWGEEFTRAFDSFLFPAALKAGLLSDPRDTLEVYCSPSVETVLKHPQIRFHTCLSESPGDRYSVIGDVMRQAIQEQFKPGEALLFLSPDVIYLSDFFHKMRLYLSFGYEAIVVPSFRADKRAFYNLPNLNPRETIAFALAHLHPITVQLFYESFNCEFNWPSCLYFPTENALIGHVWHWSPMAIKTNEIVLNRGTIDSDFIQNSNLPDSKIYFVQDSDDLCAIELSFAERPMPGPAVANIKTIRDWAVLHTTLFDRRLFAKSIVWHSEDIDDSVLKTKLKAASIADEILRSI